MVKALQVLYSLGVLDDDAKLTSPVGFQVAELPLSIWISVKGQRELDEAKVRFVTAKMKQGFFPLTSSISCSPHPGGGGV
ncbi:hypothetical protein HanIR_Chr07g0326401 [Helianthus annuus]|nr:hypothetical protein HanIR_Chr07g0326401 [Helianthus annuus]